MMQASYMEAPGKIVIRQSEVPQPRPGEVRVRLIQVGICGSDVHVFLGHRKVAYPLTLGHEAVGIIEAVGADVAQNKIGTRVVIEPNIPCGHCKFCLQGRGNICIHKQVVGLNRPGCFAETVVIPEAFAWALPDTLSDDAAVVIEPTAVAYHALFSSSAVTGSTIAILGLGAVGLLLAELALALGYQVLVTDLHPQKCQWAVDLGARVCEMSGNPENLEEELHRCWEQAGVSAVFECAGGKTSAGLSIAAAPHGSEVILVGLSEAPAFFQPLKVVRQGINIIPSIVYTHPYDFGQVIQHIEKKQIQPQQLISNRFSFEALQAAFDRAKEGRENKIVIRF